MKDTELSFDPKDDVRDKDYKPEEESTNDSELFPVADVI